MAQSELPSGTVTLLFTDIEGSTKLLDELGAERYSRALAEHRRVLREAFEQRGGVEVDTEGDSFFVVFPTAPGAVEAARAAQSDLSVPVRMGIHTGTPLITAEGYVGSDVHKAARIAAAGSGGQVLISAATAAFIQTEGLRDLGEHRLKDLSAPERIYQLGDGDFPRLKTLYQTNLPVPATPFLGRQRELAEIGTLLQRDGPRVVTLSGPGGTGKTRLAGQAAGEAADSYPDGVFWVALAPLHDPALVLDQAGQAVGSENGLADHIADKRLLLLLDNFEHLIAAARDVAELLAACPNLRLLVTSRTLLQIQGEQAYPVPPLAPPEGVELFTARALAADPAFVPTPAVEEVCARLDNLPLALELAAARVRVLSPEQLLERLGARLDLLTGGRDADPRQQTLRATLAWSHDLLDDAERGLFARLAVFTGGCTLEAAEQVADATVDALQSLFDKSLLRRTDERFWMLETIREYALERLAESGAEAELRRRHAGYFLRFAEEAARQEEEGDVPISEVVARIDADHSNLRSALEWARDSDESEILLRLAAALSYYWGVRSDYRELRAWTQLALERASSPPQARMTLLRVAASRAMDEKDFARAEARVAEHRRVAEERRRRERGPQGDEHGSLARTRTGRSGSRSEPMAPSQGASCRDGRPGLSGRDDRQHRTVALTSGDFGTALKYSTEAAELFRGLEEPGTAVALQNCGWSAFALGDTALACDSFREALVIAGRLGSPRLIAGLACGLGVVFVAEHEEERGAQLLGAASSLREELGRGFDDALEERVHEQAVADAKAALGEEAFAAAWARGQTMQPDEIMKLCDD